MVLGLRLLRRGLAVPVRELPAAGQPPPGREVEGIPVWVDNGLWQDVELDLTIDAVKDPASDSFSAESELGYRLVLV